MPPAPAIDLPRLGYGCASLMAATGRSESVGLLDEALAAGITHFDVARSYGYGEAESALGDLLSRHRDEVTVTTKAGIAPPARAARMRLVKGAARRVSARSPRLRAALRGRASAMVSAGHFEVEELRKSFEMSLRELRTDHVDVLLLHEPAPGDVGPEVLDWLAGCVSTGTTRSFGVATTREAAGPLLREQPELGLVLQIPDSGVEPPPPLAPRRTLITHSILGPTLAAARARVDAAAPGPGWELAGGESLREDAELARLLLAGALARNPHGCAIVASRTPANIRANAQVAAAPPPPAQVQAFTALLAGA